MSFLIFIIIAFLLYASFAKIRSLKSAALMIAAIFLPADGILIYGIINFRANSFMNFFSTKISETEFYLMIIIWLAANAVCTVLILRNLRAYRRVNRLDKKSA